MLTLLGCGGKPLDYVEVKRIDEVITPAELDGFLEVVKLLPGGKLPIFPKIYREPAQWSPSRTLPVSELVKEETAQIQRPWDTKYLTHEIESNRKLQRILRRATMTPEQFAGLMLAIGTAMNRSQLSEDYDFNALIQEGQKVVVSLKQNRTPFVDLQLERQFSISREAIWLNRVDRADRLRDVPRENVALVREHWKELAAIFPEEFTKDPLSGISDQLKENGIPFEELPNIGSDSEIQWNPDEALIGRDTPERSAQNSGN